MECVEPKLQCSSCGEDINLGDSMQYETSGYTAYCDNTYCTEGVATLGTCLEDCWWDDEFWEEWDKEHNPERYKKYHKENK